MAEANVTKNKPLSPEVLVKIFEHCDLDELVNIIDVCQLWRDVVIHQHMSVNDLVIRHPSDINDLISLLCKPVSFTKLRIVWDIPKDVDCSSGPLGVLTNATSLTHLQSFMFKVNAHGLGYYIGFLDAFLTLLRQTSTDTMTYLKLIDTKFDETTNVTVAACQNLSHLVLNGCSMDEANEQTFYEVIPTLTHLELLNLRGTRTRPYSLSFISALQRSCPNISNNIMIEKLRVTPTDDMRLLQFVSYIRILVFYSLNAEQFASLVSSLNERVSQLTIGKLYVSNCEKYLTDDILLSLVQRLRGLKMVDAQGCHQLTNEGVVNVITSSPELESIDICDIKNIDTDIIQLLERVGTKKNVRINSQQGTKLSDQMKNNPDEQLYTGKNRNICLVYKW